MSNTSNKSVEPPSKPLLTMSGHQGTIYRIAYIPGGKRLVTCSDDKTVRIWNVESGEQEGTSMEHDGWVQGLAVTRDGKKILSGGRDEILGLRIWDVETQMPITELGGHETTIRCIATSSDDQLVASGDSKGRIIIREMKEGGQIKHSIETGSHVNTVCFSPHGKLASGHDDQMFRVFNVESGDLILGPIEGHTRHGYSVIWSLDGSRLFTASWDQTIRCWDSETGEAIGEPWTDHTRDVNAISLSPDGTKLVSTSLDKTVRFWTTDSGDPIEQPLHHEDAVWAVAFSPSGEFVACGGRDKMVSIWRVPWWDASKEEAHKSLLDLPAVPTRPATDLNRQLDFLDLPTRRPSARTRVRNNATDVPSRTESSAFSWRQWRTLPRLLFGNSHDPPRHGEVTTIYPGFAQPRIYVASRDSQSTRESRTEPMPTAPGNYGGFSIFIESVSSTDSLAVEDDGGTAAPPGNSDQVSCCALFSRRRARSGTVPALPAIELSERAASTSSPPAPLVGAVSQPPAQNVMDLPAVVGPSSNTP